MKLNKELAKLRMENADLRQKLHDEIECRHRDAIRMRNDPTYWTAGNYAFTSAYKDRYYHVKIFNGEVRLIEKHKDHDLVLMQVPPCAPISYAEANPQTQSHGGDL